MLSVANSENVSSRKEFPFRSASPKTLRGFCRRGVLSRHEFMKVCVQQARLGHSQGQGESGLLSASKAEQR